MVLSLSTRLEEPYLAGSLGPNEALRSSPLDPYDKGICIRKVLICIRNGPI